MINFLSPLIIPSLVRPSSPRIRPAVWILALKARNSNDLEPIGTAFGVKSPSKRMLLTACHHFVEARRKTDGTKGNYFVRGYRNAGTYFILKSMQRNANGTVTYSSNIVPEQFYRGDKDEDWAILQRSDSIAFDDTALIDICRQHELPELDNEPKAKAYHAPCQLFNAVDPALPLLSIANTDFSKISQMSETHLMLKKGFVSGSSGGLVIDEVGRAIGIHLESWSPIREIVSNEQSTADEKIEDLALTAVSVANSFAFYTIAIIPCKILDLMNNLN